MNRLLRRLSAPSSALVLTLIAAHGVAVGTRRFELGTADDFKGGDLTGVAVSSDGIVQAGWDLGAVSVAEAPMVWAALGQGDAVLLATGNEGKLLEVRGAAVKVVGETKAMAATSLVEAWAGAVVVGTLPEGKVFKYQGGKLSDLVTLPETDHIWALAFDKKTNSVFAGTGPQGKLFRIDAQGKAQVHFDAEEDHLTSVAVAADGTVYAGSSDKSRLYKITAPGKASVVHDFGRTEVRGIALGPKGEVYAIANDLGGSSFAGGFSRGMNTAAGPSSSGSGMRGRGILVKFDAEGVPDTLYEDNNEHFIALTLGEDGLPYVGTGAEGRVYQVDDAHRNVMVADVGERQIAALLLGGKARFAIGSDPVVVRPIRGMGGADAVWTSKVLDAGLRARFGRLGWDGEGGLELSTRSGFTSTPDGTWTEWSRPLTAPGPVESPQGRFLQVRARFKGSDAQLIRVEVPFVTDNLRATITGIDVSSTLQRAGGSTSGVSASGGAVSRSTEARVSLSWRVDNPDMDELRYRIQFRPVGGTSWYEMLKPGEKLTSTSYSWDVTGVPEGRYKVRVLVSDEPSNPPDKVKRHERESGIILVDVTPPTLDGLRAQGRKVSTAALDGVGPIQRLEISIAGADDWTAFYPVDGIYDEQREEFDMDVGALVPAAGALLSVRVFDQAGNMTVKSIAVGR